MPQKDSREEAEPEPPNRDGNRNRGANNSSMSMCGYGYGAELWRGMGDERGGRGRYENGGYRNKRAKRAEHPQPCLYLYLRLLPRLLRCIQAGTPVAPILYSHWTSRRIRTEPDAGCAATVTRAHDPHSTRGGYAR